ncbi:MAG: RHS repeat-associated core domain-containing protein [Ignavibacteria bacterium]|jgi:RHS repeat-associated protein
MHSISRIVISVLLSILCLIQVKAQSAPTLITPSDGATNVYTDQVFSWSSVEGATSYHIQISTSSYFGWNQIDESGITTTSYQASGLYIYTPYYWRVGVVTASGTVYSSARSFTTGSSSWGSGAAGPELIAPANNSTEIPTTYTFSWNEAQGADSYSLQVSTVSSFTNNQVDVTGLTDTSYQVTGLYYATTYYWRVGSESTSGTEYSGTWSFTTGLAGGGGATGPELYSPADGATGISTDAAFTWEEVTGATYRIQISTSQYFGLNQFDEDGLTLPNFTANGLYILTPYYWRVNATTASDTSDWSETYSFTTGTTGGGDPPQAPTLVSPNDNSTGISIDTVLQWNSSSGADSYGIQVSTDSSFASFVVNQSGLTDTSYNVTGLNNNIMYFWRANAANSYGTSGWSSVWRFTTEEAILPPVLTLTQPEDSTVTNDSIIVVSGSVEDSSNTVKINGSSVTVNGDGTFTGNVLLTEGMNEIRVAAYNSINDSVIVIRNTVLDTTAPFITITNPIDSLITNLDSIDITGTAYDISPFLLTINHVEGDGIDTLIVQTDSTFTGSYNLLEGENTFIIVAEDSLGNSSQIIRKVTLDSQAPVINITGPLDGLTTEDSLVTVEGIVTDSTDIELRINGIETAVGTGGLFSKEVALSVGLNIIYISAADQAGNSAYDSVNVTRVLVLLPPDPATVATPVDTTVSTLIYESTKFLYTGDDPIIKDVDTTAIEEYRLSVVRGAVTDDDGNALPGVKVEILDHPEFGYTLSRADGMFDLVGNGGGLFNIDYGKEGYIGVQRKVEVPWRGFSFADTAAMIQYDTTVTTISFNDTIEIAKGSTVTDKDGTRTALMMFKQGTNATMTLQDGSVVPLETINVRATEYTVGEDGPNKMPAPLPPTSGYTYCVELSVDEAVEAGATKVEFDTPVPFYVDNFLDFPSGVAVPTGYYDKQKAKWLPIQDGVVIDIIAISNGVAELDINDDGSADDPDTLFNNLGINESELKKIAQNYSPGNSVWRVELEHFSPVDLNYPVEYIDLGDNKSTILSEKKVDENKIKTNNEPVICGSIINSLSQSVIEVADITGVPFSLYYSSRNTKGYTEDYTAEIPLTEDSIPSSLQYISVKINVAGKDTSIIIPPASNLTTEFVWDGLDAYGREQNGELVMAIRIGYTYLPTYTYISRDAGALFSFARRPNTYFIGSGKLTREPITSYRFTGLKVGNYKTKHIIGGWTPDILHHYDPAAEKIYFGNGSSKKAEELGLIYQTVAGKKTSGSSGDGGPAIDAEFTVPYVGDVGPDGSIYIVDLFDNKIRKISPDGIISTIAGTGEYGFSGDDGLAVDAKLAFPLDVAVDEDGNIYIADTENYRIRKVDTNGIITTIAGNGDDGVSEDGTFADQGPLSYYFNIDVDKEGNIYVADHENFIIRQIDNNNRIFTIAGTGNVGYNGEDIFAVEADLTLGGDIVVDNEGNIYFTDVGTATVRKIGVDGILNTIAGTPLEYGNDGDGGEATEAKLSYPLGIDIDVNGNIYITDFDNNNIRVIDEGGIIFTVAGEGFSIDFDDDDIMITGVSSITGTKIKKVGIKSSFKEIIKQKRIGKKAAPKSYSINALNDESDEADPYEGYPAERARFESVNGLAAGKNGELYFSLETEIKEIGKLYENFTSSNYIIPSEDGSQVFKFNKFGKHIETLNALTGEPIFKFEYDEQGLITKIIDADSLITIIDRDSNGFPVSITSPFGEVTTLNLDANGYLASITNLANETYTYNYTSDGLLTEVEDPNNNSTIYTYDSKGFLIREDDAAGGFIELARTEYYNGMSVKKTTAEGYETDYLYVNRSDGSIQVIETDESELETETITDREGSITVNTPDGTISKTFYKPDPRFGMEAPLIDTLRIATPGQLESNFSQSKTITLYTGDQITGLVDTITINGKNTVIQYDGIANTFTTQTPEGRTSVMSTDSLSRPLQTSVPGIEAVSYTYDDNGFLTSVTQGTRTSLFDYDSTGRLASTTDPMNRTERFEYDEAGRVTKQILPNNEEILYTYDDKGNLLSIQPPGKPAHYFNYTPVDFTSDYTPPAIPGDSSSTIYNYNLDKQLTSIQFSDSTFVEFEYDTTGCGCAGVGKPSRVIFDRGVYLYNYDSQTGLLDLISTSDSNSLLFDYDGSLPKSVEWVGDVKGKVSVDYNNDFQVTSQTINDTNTISFNYDDDGLLTNAGGLTLNYDSQNGLLTGTAIDSVTDSYSYNNFGEMSSYEASFNGSSLFNTVFTRDSLGRITSKTEIVLGDTNRFGYKYNSVGYLVEVERNDTLISKYEYDANGNRTKQILLNQQTTLYDTVTADYDDQDRLLRYGNKYYTYDKKGNLTSQISDLACPDSVCGDTTYYAYDNFGNLVEALVPNVGVVSYIIDGQNRRIGKMVNGVVEKRWIYEDQLNPVVEVDSAGNIVARYVYCSRINVPDYMIKNDTTYKVISDHLGSVRLIVNSLTNEIVQRITYDEFGNITSNIEELFTPFTYAGGIHDEQTNLVRFGARDYDAATGRWTAKDPTLFGGGSTNLFKYVINDPINKFDFEGKQGVDKEDIIDIIEIMYNAYSEGKEQKEAMEYWAELINDPQKMSNTELIRLQYELKKIKALADYGGPAGQVEALKRFNELIEKYEKKTNKPCPTLIEKEKPWWKIW